MNDKIIGRPGFVMVVDDIHHAAADPESRAIIQAWYESEAVQSRIANGTIKIWSFQCQNECAKP